MGTRKTESRDHSRANSSLNRPSSATLKRKDQGKKSEDLSQNIKQLLNGGATSNTLN